MEFYFPTELGEQLAFGAAVLSAIIGLVIMLAPGLMHSWLVAQIGSAPSSIYFLFRSYGGMHLGLGLAGPLVAQDWAYFAIGGAFVISSIAMLLSILFDGGVNMRNSLLLVVHLVLAALPLIYVFGLV